MKKRIALPARLEVIRYPVQVVVKLRLSTDAIRDWCLGLSLLREGLIDDLFIIPAEGQGIVELKVDASLSPQGRTLGSFSKSEVACFALPLNVLEFMLAFSLRCYRDGYAEVDHFDIESEINGISEIQNSYFTVTFPESAPPLSFEELKRRVED